MLGGRAYPRRRAAEMMDARGRSVPGALGERAAVDGERVALEVAGGVALTFGAWQSRAAVAARSLVSLGVGRGRRVVVECRRDDWVGYAVAYVAVQQAGGVVVPVRVSAGQDAVVRLAHQARAVGVVGESADHEPSTLWTVGLEALERRGGKESLPVVGGDDDAEILYTSGTTGVAKGVLSSHGNLLFTQHTVPRGRGETVVMHSLPPATQAGQGLLLQPLDADPHRIVVQARFQADEFLALVASSGATHVVLVPAQAMALVKRRGHEYDVGAVRNVRTTSAPVTAQVLAGLAELFPNAAITNMYATTESWPARVRTVFDATRPTSVGRPVGDCEVRIADREGGDPRSGGEVQLRCVGAPHRRYVDDAAATDTVFLDGGWVRTGDVGFLDDGGFLYLLDREDDVVITGGLNVSTQEVEAVCAAVPGIEEAAAFGLPHGTLGQYVALAALRSGDIGEHEVLAFAERMLGYEKAPKRVFWVDALPRNELGKVLKRELRTRFADEEAAEILGAEPERSFVDRVAWVWGQVLERQGVPAGVGFVALGGSSLSAAEVVVMIQKELGLVVSERDVREASDIRDFAVTVERAAGGQTEP
jgi:long-chain acyl-CoA synthetase